MRDFQFVNKWQRQLYIGLFLVTTLAVGIFLRHWHFNKWISNFPIGGLAGGGLVWFFQAERVAEAPPLSPKSANPYYVGATIVKAFFILLFAGLLVLIVTG